ncbi:MAG: DUF1501 domain-containing protein [Luteolibacter sp.]
MKTRRQFLRTSVLGASTLWTMPGFIDRTMGQIHQDALKKSATQLATGRDHPILVIVQLAGGNDGINTVIPYAESNYHRSRPDIRLKENQVLKLDDALALHPSLKFLESSFKDGQLAILNGVGYPNPNRSHFKSTDLWSIGSESGNPAELGWVGRYFDNECPGSDAMRAVTMAGDDPLMLQGINRHSTQVSDLGQFAFNALGENMLKNPVFRGMQQPVEKSPCPEDNRDFVQRVALDTLATSEQLGALARGKQRGNYPSSGIGQQLQRVGNMIEAKATTRIYYVSHGGFDTHSGQAGRHAELLTQLDDALRAFSNHIQQLGEFDRVALMTFSEFGRQLRQNGTQGTDHGAAAPMFLLGGAVKPGLLSPYPSLDKRNLYGNGDLKHTIDFRQVYAAVLEQYLKADSKSILGATFQAPTLFKS